MSKRGTSVARLAQRASLDIEETLLRLWDAGIDSPESPDSLIPGRLLPAAERAVGMGAPRDRMKVDYWTDLLAMERDEFVARAAEHNVVITANMRKLPKGSLRRLERLAADRGHPMAKNLTEGTQPEPVAVPTPFQMSEVGHSRSTIAVPTADEIEEIHWTIAMDFADSADPISPAGVRDNSLLASAASRPHTGLGGVFKYKTVEMRAAALTHSIVHNHPFYNGNKRTALVSLLVMLDSNGFLLSVSQRDLFKWMIKVAGHRIADTTLVGDRSDIEVHAMAKWITRNSRQIDTRDRVVRFRELRNILKSLGCAVGDPESRGGKVTVTRAVEVDSRGIFGSRSKLVERKFILPYDGEGREVAKQRVRKLREELHLDEVHGVDASYFYGMDSTPADVWVAKYRKTLAKLART